MNRGEKGRQQQKMAASIAKTQKPEAFSIGALSVEQSLLRAVKHHNAGRLSEAETLYKKVLGSNPNQPDALQLLGVLASQTGKNNSAVDFITRALTIAPNHAEAHNNLGKILKELGRLDEAISHYQKALALKPQFVEAHYNLGNGFMELGKLDDAVASYHKALAINPDSAEVHRNLGLALNKLGEIDEATKSFRKALAIKPGSAGVHFNLGSALRKLGQLDAAVASFNQTLAIKPDYAEAHNNLGVTFHDLGRMDEAVASYRKTIAIKPDYAEAYSNLGATLHELGRTDEASACYRQALAIWPDFADAHCNLGFALLDLGRVKEGLDEFEWRWKISANRASQRDFNQPQWDGAADLNGRTILLWSEQGIGDNLNWASCLSRVVSQAGLCIVETQPKLVSLLSRSFPNADVCAEDRNAQPTDIDFHLPLGSLYHRLYPNIEHPTGTYLIPDPKRVAFWKRRLAELGPGPHIGMSWTSSVITPKRAPNYTRIVEWSPIFASRDAVFVNLQYGDCKSDLAAANRDIGVVVHTFDDLDLYDDLDNVAALSKALDLIITVDNINAVISAGVGTPTWLLTWRQSSNNNFFCGPRGPSLARFERNTDETWGSAFEEMAGRLKLRVFAQLLP
jgi:tetratricopeptide (TPR) repeat protein